MTSVRAAALLLFTACGTADPAADPAAGSPTDDEPVTRPDGTEHVPAPRGVETLAPADLTARVDAASARCDAGQGALLADVLGVADRLEVDRVDGEVRASVAAANPADADAVWRGFTAAVDCEGLDAATFVLRAYRGAELVDCAVVGPSAAAVLAGDTDAALAAAGRPGARACRPL